MLHQVRGFAQRMADKPGEKKRKKLSNVGTTKQKEILVWKTEQEIFEATKLVIETQHGAKGLEVNQSGKPNQTRSSAVFSISFTVALSTNVHKR